MAPRSMGADSQTQKLAHYLDSYVKDDGRVVSYKWFCREHSISSSHAKKVLIEYALQNKQTVKSMWIASGWTPEKTFVIRLINDEQLEREKENGLENGWIYDIYSVQLNYPLDFSALCNEELTQMQSLLISGDHTKQDSFFQNRSIKCPELKRVEPSTKSFQDLPPSLSNTCSLSIEVNGATTPTIVNQTKAAAQETSKFVIQKEASKHDPLKIQNVAKKAKVEKKEIRKQEANQGLSHLWKNLKKNERKNSDEPNSSGMGTVSKELNLRNEDEEIEKQEGDAKRLTSDKIEQRNEIIQVSDSEEEKEIKYSVSRSKRKNSSRKRKNISDDEEEYENVRKEERIKGDETLEESKIICSQPQSSKDEQRLQTQTQIKESQLRTSSKVDGEIRIPHPFEQDHSLEIEKRGKRKMRDVTHEIESFSEKKFKSGTDILEQSTEEPYAKADNSEDKGLFDKELEILNTKENVKAPNKTVPQPPKTSLNQGKNKKQVRKVVDEKGRETFEVIWVDENAETEEHDTHTPDNPQPSSSNNQSVMMHSTHKPNETTSKPPIRNNNVNEKNKNDLLKPKGGKLETAQQSEKEKGKKTQQGTLLSFFGKK